MENYSTPGGEANASSSGTTWKLGFEGDFLNLTGSICFGTSVVGPSMGWNDMLGTSSPIGNGMAPVGIAFVAGSANSAGDISSNEAGWMGEADGHSGMVTGSTGAGSVDNC